MAAKPQRADRYEAQLTDGELLTLHEGLLAGKTTLAKLREKSPAWRSGYLAGRKPSLQTLSNIRDRLGLKATLEENAATTETLLEEIRSAVPEITSDQLEEFGHRAFSLMALRQQDVKAWVALQRTQKDRGDLALAQAKFQRETCTLFLKWYEDERAKAIAGSGASRSDKIEQLGQMMFGETWNSEGTEAAVDTHSGSSQEKHPFQHPS